MIAHHQPIDVVAHAPSAMASSATAEPDQSAASPDTEQTLVPVDIYYLHDTTARGQKENAPLRPLSAGRWRRWTGNGPRGRPPATPAGRARAVGDRRSAAEAGSVARRAGNDRARLHQKSRDPRMWRVRLTIATVSAVIFACRGEGVSGHRGASLNLASMLWTGSSCQARSAPPRSSHLLSCVAAEGRGWRPTKSF
jgi:hypothetical protein